MAWYELCDRVTTLGDCLEFCESEAVVVREKIATAEGKLCDFVVEDENLNCEEKVSCKRWAGAKQKAKANKALSETVAAAPDSRCGYFKLSAVFPSGPSLCLFRTHAKIPIADNLDLDLSSNHQS